MDQNRLYYATPYVKTFMCTVISCTKNKKGTWVTDVIHLRHLGKNMLNS